MVQQLHENKRESAGENARFIEARVRRARASMRFWHSVARVGERLWFVPLLVTAVLLFDAVSPMPAMVRFMSLLGVGALFVWAVLSALFIPAQARASRSWAARRLEALLGAHDNVVLNALQLTPLANSGGALQFEQVLAHRSVDRAANALKGEPFPRAGNTARARRVWGRALASLLVLMAVAILAPRVVGQTAPRFVAPFGDHPPYSQTEFSIDIAPSRPLVGEDVEVKITLGGAIPEYLQLVVRAADDGTIARHNLNAMGSEIKSVRLRALRRPVDVQLEGDTGWSRWTRIEPVDEPRVMSAALTITAPERAGGRARTWMIDTDDTADAHSALAGSTVEIRAVFSTDIAYSTMGESSHSEIAGESAWQSSAAGREARGWGSLNRVGNYEIAFDAFSHAGLGLETPIVVRLDVVDAATIEQETRRGDDVAATSASGAMNGKGDVAEVMSSGVAVGGEEATGDDRGEDSLKTEENGQGEDHGGEAMAESASENSGDGNAAGAGPGSDRASGRLGEGTEELNQPGSRKIEADRDESSWARFVAGAHELTGEEGVRRAETMRAVAPAYRELTARYFWRLAQDDVDGETNEQK